MDKENLGTEFLAQLREVTEGRVQNETLPEYVSSYFQNKNRGEKSEFWGSEEGRVSEGRVQNLASLPTTACNEPAPICIVSLPLCLCLTFLPDTYLPPNLPTYLPACTLLQCLHILPGKPSFNKAGKFCEFTEILQSKRPIFLQV